LFCTAACYGRWCAVRPDDEGGGGGGGGGGELLPLDDEGDETVGRGSAVDPDDPPRGAVRV
jgi:hypothetical protein